MADFKDSERTGSKTLSDETLTTVFTVDVRGRNKLFVQIDNTVTVLDQFVIKGRIHPDAAFQTLFSTSADYTAPTGILVGTSGDLTVIAAGATGWFLIDVSSFELIQIQAARAAGSNAVLTYFFGRDRQP